MTNCDEMTLVERDARGGSDDDTRGFFTLIELLDPPRLAAPNPDSTAILIGLLLPAVQKVR